MAISLETGPIPKLLPFGYPQIPFLHQSTTCIHVIAFSGHIDLLMGQSILLIMYRLQSPAHAGAVSYHRPL